MEEVWTLVVEGTEESFLFQAEQAFEPLDGLYDVFLEEEWVVWGRRE